MSDIAPAVLAALASGSTKDYQIAEKIQQTTQRVRTVLQMLRKRGLVRWDGRHWLQTGGSTMPPPVPSSHPK